MASLEKVISSRWRVSLDDAKAIVRWTEDRNARLLALIPAAGFLAFVAWCVVIGTVVKLCRALGFDPLADVSGLSDGQYLLVAAAGMLLGPGVGLFWTLVTVSVLKRRLLLRRIARAYGTPACFACDYGLAGLVEGSDRPTCPECGTTWPPVGGKPGAAARKA